MRTHDQQFSAASQKLLQARRLILDAADDLTDLPATIRGVSIRDLRETLAAEVELRLDDLLRAKAKAAGASWAQ